jgi:hypothetical protein
MSPPLIASARSERLKLTKRFIIPLSTTRRRHASPQKLDSDHQDARIADCMISSSIRPATGVADRAFTPR